MIATLKRWSGRVRLKESPQTGLLEALLWLMASRLTMAFFVLLTVVISQVFRESGLYHNYIPIYSLLAGAFAFNLLTLSVVERLPDRVWVWGSQILFDTTLIALGTDLTHGKSSFFALFCLIQILTSSLVFLKKGARLSAAAAVVGYAWVLSQPSGVGSFVDWSVFSALFITVGLVGGYLSQELQDANKILELKRIRMRQMVILQERILSELPTGLLTLDVNGKIGFINPAGASILGRSATEMIGTTLEAVAPGLLPFVEAIEARAVGDGISESHHSYFMQSRSDHASTRLQQKVEIGKGAHRRVLRGDVAVLDSSLSLDGVLGGGTRIVLFQDVTSLEQLENKAKQNEKLAAVGQLAAGIAHEIRNPLASMSASIEMLKGAFPTAIAGEENHRLMDIAIREIDRLNRLISEFLDFVKPEKFKFVPVPLEALLSDVVLAAKSQPDTKGRIEIEEKYEDVRVSADSGKLRQVIWNLVVNAMQAIPGKGKIIVGCRSLGAVQAVLWVEDTGQGMDEDVRFHLFEPFFTTKDRGTGLGLATAYKIVEAHRGEIKVNSRVGEGTRFEVILPRT